MSTELGLRGPFVGYKFADTCRQWILDFIIQNSGNNFLKILLHSCLSVKFLYYGFIIIAGEFGIIHSEFDLCPLNLRSLRTMLDKLGKMHAEMSCRPLHDHEQLLCLQ